MVFRMGRGVAKSSQLNYNKTLSFYNQNKERIDKYLETCDRYDVRPVDMAIKWVIRKGIYPVLGASSPEQLTDTLNGLSVEISDKIWQEFEKI